MFLIMKASRFFGKNGINTSSSLSIITFLGLFSMAEQCLLSPASCIRDFFTLKKLQSRIQIMTVCYYHVTYAIQSESTLYSCLNVKLLLGRNRRDI